MQQRINAYHELCPELNQILSDEVDTGLAIATELHLTPAQYYRATGRDRLADELGIPGTERLLALSDGVVAIALTLLVLELVVPVVHGAGADKGYVLWDRLFAEKDRLVAYLVSFYVIATFWLVHHRTFRLIQGHSESLAWWNFGYLFTITLIPFSSGLLGADGGPLEELCDELAAARMLAQRVLARAA